MIYFKTLNDVELFIRYNVFNNKKTIYNPFYPENDEIYLKNSIKKYHNISEIVEELKNGGLLHEIIEYVAGYGKGLNSIGYVLYYSLMMRYLEREDEPLINDINVYKLLTINQVCEFLNVSRPTVYKMLNDGDLPFLEILGQKRIQVKDLLSFIQSKTSK